MLGTMYSQLHTFEPIRQLTSPGGISGPALAGSTGGSAYFASVAAGIGGAFAAGATSVDTTYCVDPNAPASSLNPCPPRLSATPWVLDVVLVTLVIQVVVIVYTATKWFKKPSDMSGDPTTIAGVVTVMGHPEVEALFAGMPGEISKKELKERLQGRRFRLGTFMVGDGMSKFGIMPTDGEREGKKDGFLDRIRGKLDRLGDRMSPGKSWQNSRLYFDIVFGLLLVALFGLTTAAVSRVDQPQTVFLATASASGTGMRIFFALLGMIISNCWGRLFQGKCRPVVLIADLFSMANSFILDAQTFTPYQSLGDGEGKANPTILMSRHSIPLLAIVPLLRNGHFAAASVATTGLISEFLVVFLSGLPYRPGQLRSEFLFCGIASMIILGLMVVQLAFINFWRRQLPHLPRRPDSIAAVMTYVAGTSMARDFYGLEEDSTRERNKAIRGLDKTYAYGWRKEEGGRVRWVVDEVSPDDDKSLVYRPSGEA